MDIKEKLKTFIDKKKLPKSISSPASLSRFADDCSPADFENHVAIVGWVMVIVIAVNCHLHKQSEPRSNCTTKCLFRYLFVCKKMRNQEKNI